MASSSLSSHPLTTTSQPLTSTSTTTSQIPRAPHRALLLLGIACAVAALLAAPEPVAAQEGCDVPWTGEVRGKDVVFDECHFHTFSHGGDDYSVTVYFTTETDPDEEPAQTNLEQCEDEPASRCDHAIDDDTNADGENTHAAGLAEDVEASWRFLIDRDIRVIRGGERDMKALVGRDPRGGGINWWDEIYIDRRNVDGDALNRLRVAFHEIHHLTQGAYRNGWNSFYGEGIARASEARFHTGTRFRTASQINGFLGRHDLRRDSIEGITYNSAAFWTWLFDEYRASGETVPDIGWGAIRDYYLALESDDAQVPALGTFAGSSMAFRSDFVDYTLALAAYRYVEPAHRLGFADPYMTTETSGLRDHSVRSGNPSVASTAPAGERLRGVAYGNQTWVAVGYGGTVLTSTDDGHTWFPQPTPASEQLLAIDQASCCWVATGLNGTVLTSNDRGQTWSGQTTPTSSGLNGVAHSGGTWVAVGYDGTLLTSTDRESWVERSTPTSEHLHAIARGGGTWVAAGSEGTVLTSSDGQSWVERSTPTSEHLLGVAHRGGTWRAVGYGGTILVSTDDGVSWESEDTPTSVILRAVSGDGGTWVSVGDGGTVLVFDDDDGWEDETSGTGEDLTAIAYGAGTWTAVGGNGVVVASPGSAKRWVDRTQLTMNERSAQHVEIRPDADCAFASFGFSSPTTAFDYSVLTVGDDQLVQRWTTRSSAFHRTVHTADLDSVFGIVSAYDQPGAVDITSGCVDPTIEITRPTTAAFATVGRADNPRNLVVRVRVEGPEGDPVAGLVPEAFDVSVVTAGGDTLDAEVLTGAYVQSSYWLLVAPPDADAGAQDAAFHDLHVQIGPATATQNQSVLYVERTQDAVTVLDVSGSMGFDTGRIEAARNAAGLLVGELAEDDQGALVTFSTDAELVEALAPVGTDDHRASLEDAIAAQTPGGLTAIGEAMQVAAAEEAARGLDDHMCSFILLSDGYENQDPRWADVRDEVAARGCAIHAIALGPRANETLLQQISATVPGGTYDYADTEGDMAVGSSTTSSDESGSASAFLAGAQPGGEIGWANHLARIYDAKVTQMADRDRVYSAGGYGASACGDDTTTVDFNDLDAGTVYEVGATFISGGVPVSIGAYEAEPGFVTEEGSARVNDDPFAGGSGNELLTHEALARFDFPGGGCQVTFRFGVLRGQSVNLLVNGVRRSARDLQSLHGAQIAGVEVSVVGTNGQGIVTLTGPIGSFGVGGDNLAVDDVVHTRAVVESHDIEVDATATELVVAMAWQHDEGHRQRTVLRRPDGTAVPEGQRTRSGLGTNEVWRVNPTPGTWTFEVDGLGQEHVVTASAITDYRLHLLIGEDEQARSQGAIIPILAVVEGPDGPVAGADVRATVRDPDGRVRTLLLRDDGNHGDGAAGNGIYGGSYTATSFGNIPEADDPDDGAEPESRGSYLVDVVSVTDGVRREAQGSFAIAVGPDSDGDGIPDLWEERFGFDPTDPTDADDDADGDGLDNRCEYEAGTNPRTSDTSGGGERDSEIVAQPAGGRCFVVEGRDPHDPDEDRVDPLVSFRAVPEAHTGIPEIVLTWDPPARGTLVSVDIYRQPLGRNGKPSGPWVLIAPDLDGTEYEDDDVDDGDRFRYRVVPRVNVDGITLDGRILETPPVEAREDPYPPEGSVLINEGAASTPSRTVRLSLGVDDMGAHAHGYGGSSETVVGSPADAIEMRLSNDGERDGPWQPFQEEVESWDLGDVEPGDLATVHVEFRDEAGNVGSSGFAQVDTILYSPTTRFSGATRIQTAIDVSEGSFSDRVAVAGIVARADNFPDALAGIPLAAAKGGPLLLTGTSSLHPDTAAELTRVLRPGRTVYLLGGEGAISAAVEQELAALGFETVRLSGATRIETAVAIAEEIGNPDPLLVTTGFDFPDALSAGSAAAFEGGAVLLTVSDGRHPATDAYLASRPDVTLYGVGGPAARPYSEAIPLFGPGREETAVAVAEELFPRAPAIGLARRDVFADALAGGPHAGQRRAPILLTPPTFLHPATEAYLCGNARSVSGAFVYGGTAAISDDVMSETEARLGGSCPSS
jgi:hypothetical protein